MISKTVVLIVFVGACLFTVTGCNSSGQNKVEVSETESTSEVTQEKAISSDIDLKISEDIFDSFQEEKFDSITRYFNSSLLQSFNTEQLKVVWGQLEAQFGTLDGKGEVSSLGNIIFIECNFSKQKLYLKLVFTADHQVTGIFFLPSKT